MSTRHEGEQFHEPAHRMPCGVAVGGGAQQTPWWVAERMLDIRAAFCLDTVADPAAATRARREFAAWLGIDVDHAQGEDIVLAVYEALANAAEHAYAGHPGGPGTMSLTAHRGPGHVRITVADHGHWRAENATGTDVSFRGRGLELMQALMTHVHVRTDQHGTLVWLRAAVAPTTRPREV